MMQAGDFRGALKRAEQFFATCGDYLRLRWVTYGCYKRLSEFDRAIEEVTKLVEADPYDKDYRWWRGIVHEQKGNWQRAAEDYEQALSLEPKLRSVPINLANMYEKLQQPCKAAATLQQLVSHHPKAKGTEAIRQRAKDLGRTGRCAQGSAANRKP